MSYVIIWSLINKKEMPKILEEYSLIEKIKRSRQLLPVIVLILAVIGSIYTGIATATEAASLGVVGALILSYFQKSLNFDTFKSSLLGATKTSCMIAFILAGSTFLSLAMGFTGLPRNLAMWIQNMDLSPYILIFVFTFGEELNFDLFISFIGKINKFLRKLNLLFLTNNILFSFI